MIVDGMVMRLASSGPKILIKLESASEQGHNNQDEDKVSSTRQPRDSKSTLIN